MWVTYRILYTQTLKLKFQAQGVASNTNIKEGITVDFYDKFRA